MTAKSRYDDLVSGRSQFLDSAEEASKLTLPYLIRRDDNKIGYRTLLTPWQSVGSKGL